MADLAELSREILAPKVRDLFIDDDGDYIPSDYKTMHGGRGGLKSWGFGRMAILLAATTPLRVACAREYQTSIEESVHQTLASQIPMLGLERYFDIGKHAITGYNGSRFFFAGIKTDPGKFKSTENIDILWIEEGEKVSEMSWREIEPTIRKPGSEIWCGFNPDLADDATSKRFIGKNVVPNARIIETNWRDNPWLSDRLVRQKDYLARVDPDAYQHVWEGKFRTNSAAQILKGKYVVEAFTPGADWTDPMYGADWGFSVDPTTLVKCWIYGRKLFIEYEAWQIGCEMERIGPLFDTVPGAKNSTIFADNARPETISYVKRHGYGGLFPVEKWAGSVEDGVSFLRQFEQIVIHPRCVHTADEARMYRYKVDPRDDTRVLTDIVDADNHCIDAIRYALHQKIRTRGMGIFDYYREEAEKAAAERNGPNGNVPGH